jgi:hopanoid-associated phosphorylase
VSAPLLTVSGLAREAAIAAGPGVRALAASGPRLEGLIRTAISEGVAGIFSFGIAGGLDPKLGPGTPILATGVIAASQRWPCDAAWRQRLARHLPEALAGELMSVDAPVLTAADKRALAATGALAVDMESHIAARLAAAHGLPFAALRIVCDPAERAIPAAAIAGFRDDGGTDLGAIFVALCRDPRQLATLLRLARDARAAFASLALCRRRLDVEALSAAIAGERVDAAKRRPGEVGGDA